MNKWKDPALSLGERCVLFSQHELQNGVSEDKVGSYTSPRIREYFSICTRLANGKETPIKIVSGNWCAASASFVLKECLLPGETAPHGFRLGVVEIVYDMTGRHLYQPITKVRNGLYKIKIGDVIVFDRSNPSDPATSWYRHIGRVCEIGNDDSFDCISGNSGGRWRITHHTLSQANLLGFGSYPELNINSTSVNVLTDGQWGHVTDQQIAPTEDTGKDLELGNFYKHYVKIFGK